MLDRAERVAAEMQLRELAREQVIERVLLQQEADKDLSLIPPAAVEITLHQFRVASSGGSTCITPMNGITRQLGTVAGTSATRV